MGRADEAYAVACAVPANAPGLTMIASTYGGRTGSAFEHPISARHKMMETLTVFDDVKVPWHRVFLKGEVEMAGPLAKTFVEFHRFTAVSYKLPLVDLFVGAGHLMAEYNGILGAHHVRDKLARLISYAQICRGMAREAARESRMVGGIAVPNAELRWYYSAADVFCLASEKEGWPNVILESLACGTPVVAAATWGVPEVLPTEDYGLLVKDREPGAFSERIGEALRLDRDDVDLVEGVLGIRLSKFGKSREVPLHASTARALRGYLRRRDRLHPPPSTPALFISPAGTRLLYCNVHATFRQLRRRAGLQPRSASCRPRIHDLRHTFAIRTLLDGYQTDGDVQRQLSLLATYLGHVHPDSTYWYLSAAPELLALAGQRLERHLRGRP
jgi:hypothetical protein